MHINEDAVSFAAFSHLAKALDGRVAKGILTATNSPLQFSSK